MKSDTKTYTTFKISKMCDVYPTTVAKWIDEGKLKAYSTPGGHRRVRYDDLIEFLKKYRIPVPAELMRERRIKILIVDDDEDVLESVEKILEMKIEKYKIYSARDGFQAGQMVSDFKPQIVVLDVMLPGLDGFNVCAAIKERNENVMILAITGFDSPETRKNIFEAGADDYLPKPFGMKSFLEKIEKLENPGALDESGSAEWKRPKSGR